MELKQWQLMLIIVGTFAAIIALDLVLQYQSDENFRANFPKLPSAMFAKVRAPQMVAEEMQVVHPAEPTFTEQESGPSEDS
jgi:hypothetical protein